MDLDFRSQLRKFGDRISLDGRKAKFIEGVEWLRLTESGCGPGFENCDTKARD